MPARITIYCRRPIETLDAAALRAAIDEADLYTLAEGLDLPGGEEAAVDTMRQHLVVHDNLEIDWMPAMRPLQIEIWDGETRRAIIAERLDELADEDAHAGLERIRAQLAATIAIVSIEAHLDAPTRLDGVLAEVIAYHCAEVGDGLVEFYGTTWASSEDWGETIWQRGVVTA